MRRTCAFTNLLLVLVSLCGLSVNIAQAQAPDLTIYDDALQNGWQNYSWATVNLANTNPTHSGSDSASVQAAAYQAIYVHHAAFDSTSYLSLTFWINGGSGGGQRLGVQGLLAGSPQTVVRIGPLAANTWQQVTIPLSSLGVANCPNLDGFWIQDTTGSTQPIFYVDDITLNSSGVIPPSSANLTVDASSQIRTIDNRLFGLNTAVWDGQFNTALSQNLLTTMGNQVLRFPGGSTSDGYNWQTGKSTGGNNPWVLSFSKFAIMAENLNQQAYITVNYGNGTPEMAAAWVAYANGSTSSTLALGTDSKGKGWHTVGYWATIRASAKLANDDGFNFLRISHPAPFGFKYWEIGNECYGSWENDQHGVSGSGLTGLAHDGYTYAQASAVFIKKMKTVDPTLKIGVVGVPSEDTWGDGKHGVKNPNEGNSVHTGWSAVILANLKSLGVTPDFFIDHHYSQGPGNESDSVLLQSGTKWLTDATKMRKCLTDYIGASGINVELAATEVNSVSSNPGKQSVSLVNGLFFADNIGSMLQTEFNSCVWWDFHNASSTSGNSNNGLYGWRPFGDYGITAIGDRADTPLGTPYPTWYAAKLLTYWGRGGDQVVSAASDYNMLSVYAAKLQNGDLSLLLINKSATTDLTGHVSIAGWTSGITTANVYQYGKSQDQAKADIAQSSAEVGNTFDCVVPSYSMMVVVLATDVAPPPTTPSGLTAVTAGPGQINLSWNSSAGATGYNVLRGSSAGGAYTQIDTTTSTSTSYQDLGLPAGTSFFYVVQATNSTGSSANSNEAHAATQSAPPIPTGLSAAASSASQIDLSWNTSPGATSYILSRATAAGGPYNPVGAPTGNSFSDTGLGALTTYYYVVQATNGAQSANSLEAHAATQPAPPASLAATAISATQINLTWNAVPGAASYNVYRGSATGSPYTKIGNRTVPNYNSTGLSPSTTYFYVVTTMVGAAQSANSGEAVATTQPIPPAPTGLMAAAVSASQINLTWNPSPGATGYTVYRGTTSGGLYSQIATRTVTNFNNTGLSPLTTYFYVVRATNGPASPNSSEAQATTHALPAAPTGLTAATISSTQINLAWNSVPGATGYKVSRSATSGGPYTSIATRTVPNFNNTGLAHATTYFYVVAATTSDGTSPNSAEAQALTSP